MIVLLKGLSFAIWLLIMLVMIVGGHKYAILAPYRSGMKNWKSEIRGRGK